MNLAVEEEVSGFGPLHICSHLGLLDSATYLLSSSSSASSSSSSSLTSLLLDPNSWTSDGTQTALHICVESESENKKRMLVLLLRKGGDPNLRDYNGRTPMEIAKEMDCSEDFALAFSSFSNSSTPAIVVPDIPKKVFFLLPFSSPSPSCSCSSSSSLTYTFHSFRDWTFALFSNILSVVNFQLYVIF